MYRIHKGQCLDALKRDSSWEMEMGVILRVAYRMGQGGSDYDPDVARILLTDGSNGEKKIGWVGLYRALKAAGEQKKIR